MSGKSDNREHEGCTHIFPEGDRCGITPCDDGLCHGHSELLGHGWSEDLGCIGRRCGEMCPPCRIYRDMGRKIGLKTKVPLD